VKSIQNKLISVLALGVLATGVAQAQVNTSLVAADSAAQPGKPLTVALKMEHEHGWHTYWVNPGIGEATSVEWELPAGWTAGEIEWPVPHTIKGEDGAVTGHGYEGTSYLPITFNVPKTAKVGETVTLKGKAKWLMCSSETCVPGSSSVEVKVPVAASATPNVEVRSAMAGMPMPKAADAWKVKASSDGAMITVKIAGAGELKSPHFFPRTEIVSYDAQQKFNAASGELTITLPIDKYYEGDKKAIEGVLSYTDASGKYVGVPIKAPLS
jgi:DsbC/DsbD-like thiol-disulfide interchange protein